ncbi:MAG: AsmA-like C-terminal region-containing protein, partial [Hyphomicrobiaceae bacterium]
AVGNLDVDLQASYLTDGARALHDVVAQLDVGNGSITFKRLHFNTSSGLDLDLQGRLDRLNENPSGRLRGWVNALDPRSVSSLIDGLDVGHGPLAGPWMHNLSKVELGFTADFGPRSPRALVIDANGTVDGARVEIDLSLGGGLEGWRARPVDLTVRLNSPQAHGLLRKLTTGERVLPGGSDGPGMLLIKSAGENAASLLTFVRLEAPRALTVFNGRTSITEAGFIDLDGVAQVRFDTIRDALSLARMTRLPNVGRISARGKVTVKRAEGSTILGSSGDFAVDGVGVSGKLAVSTGGEGKVSLDGKLGTESASIPKLLGLMLAGRPSDAASPAADTGLNGPSPWPEAPFALDIVRNVEGRLAITTPTLKLDDGLAVSDAAMTVDIKPGLVSLTSLTGKASGGRVAVKSTFRNTSAGADVSIEGRLNGAQLALMAGTGMVQPNGASRGSADIALRLSGRALSPRTVISALKGSGEIVLHDVVLTGISSRAVDDAAAELIDREGAITGEALEAALTKRLAAGKLALGSRRIGIGIGDGALRIDSFDIDTERARITNTSTIDLATLKIDSEWKMQPLKQLVVGRKTLTKTPLPSVSLVWTGPIQGVAAQSPRISLGALERELVVRKMERDVERLEDLRRSDDERMRHETERLRRERLNRGSVPPNPVRQGAPAKVPPPVIVAPLPLNSLPPAGDASIDAARRVPPSALTAGQAEAATSPAGSLNGQQPTSSAPAPVPRRVRPRPPPPPAFVPPFGD